VGKQDTQEREDSKGRVLPTIWHVPDPLWERVKGLIDELDPPKPTGRKRIDPRRALDAIIFRMRTGCQWNQLPKELPDDSSVHRTFQRWDEKGLFDKLWAILLLECEELGDVNWRWQSADAQMGKARGVPKKGQRKRALEQIPRIEGRRERRRASS